MCRWKSSRMEAERFDEPRSSLFALAAAEYCPLLPQARLNSLVVVVVVVAIELEPMACCYITSFSVTLPFAQDSLVRASMDHRMDNSFLESCRIEGVHFRDLIDVCLAWGGIIWITCPARCMWFFIVSNKYLYSPSVCTLPRSYFNIEVLYGLIILSKSIIYKTITVDWRKWTID